MKTIWKFSLDDPMGSLQMPIGAEILCLQIQRGVPCIWVKVDDSAKVERRTFIVVGTGHKLSVNANKYIGTFQEANGDLIWHVFETTTERRIS
jgi:hypothetical protein